jgi:hypothetical protein
VPLRPPPWAKAWESRPDNESLETEGKVEKWAGKAKGAVDEAVDDLTDGETHRN